MSAKIMLIELEIRARYSPPKKPKRAGVKISVGSELLPQAFLHGRFNRLPILSFGSIRELSVRPLLRSRINKQTQLQQDQNPEPKAMNLLPRERI